VVLKDSVHRRDERRLRLPEQVPPYKGLYYVQEFGNACPQHHLTLPNGLDSELRKNINEVVARVYDRFMATDEDCKDHVILPNGRELNDSRGLTINVVTPASATPRSRLPVLVVCIFALTSRHDGSLLLNTTQWIFGGGFQVGGTSTFVPFCLSPTSF
jgi:acetylcholinesterase